MIISPQINNEWHVCSLIVQVTPTLIEYVVNELNTYTNLEIAGINNKDSKFVVVIESNDSNYLYDQIESIKKIDHVIDVALVYHQQDEAD